MTSSFCASCLRSALFSASRSRWRRSMRFCRSVPFGWMPDALSQFRMVSVQTPRCANRFFVRLHRNDAGILAYCKEFLCDMTENTSADAAQSRQTGFVRCCLYILSGCGDMPRPFFYFPYDLKMHDESISIDRLHCVLANNNLLILHNLKRRIVE